MRGPPSDGRVDFDVPVQAGSCCRKDDLFFFGWCRREESRADPHWYCQPRNSPSSDIMEGGSVYDSFDAKKSV